MKNKIDLPVPEKCVGCGVCSFVCPRACLKMVPDALGFLYPRVSDGCVSCGKCVRYCPVLNPGKLAPIRKVFAGWSTRPAVRISAASGGVFSALAEKWLADGGVVVGAAYDDRMRVRHVICRDGKDLAALRGSKYVQSDLGEIFKESCRVILEEKRPLLFCGTPCQCAALRALCGDSEQLFLCDLICYGVGAPEIFRRQIDFLERRYGDRIIGWNMRDKRFGWQYPVHVATFKCAGPRILRGRDDIYSSGYSRGLFMRESCYGCRFCTADRTGDLTLGDFWGLKDDAITRDDCRRGISLIAAISERGEKLLQDLIADGKLVCRQEEIAMAVSGNIALRKCAESAAHGRFREDMSSLSFPELQTKYFHIPLWKALIKRFVPLRLQAYLAIRRKLKS